MVVTEYVPLNVVKANLIVTSEVNRMIAIVSAHRGN